MKFFEKKRNRGAVSIFLVMILIPTMLLSAVLIDGSRMVSAKAMTQEAADLAAFSALAAYDTKLKDEFGLFAIKDSDKIEKVYKESLEATLLASGLSENKEYSEKLWELMKSSVGLNSRYDNKKFLNLYDFQIDSCNVEPQYPLAEKDVLQSQMVEYAKFRGIYIMVDRLGLLKNLGSAKEEARKNQESAEVMEEKMDVDEKNADADEALAQLMKQVNELNEAVNAVFEMKEQYLEDLPAYMEKVKIENTGIEGETVDNRKVKDYEEIVNTASFVTQQAQIMAKQVLQQAEITKKSLEEAIGRLEQFQSGHEIQAQENETINGLSQDAQDDILRYKNIYLAGVQNLLDDLLLRQLSDHENIGSTMSETMEKIENAIQKYAEELEEQREKEEETDEESEEAEEEEEILPYYFYYVDLSGYEEDSATAIYGGRDEQKYYQPAVSHVIQYLEDAYWSPVNPAKDLYEDEESNQPDKIDEEIAAEQSNREDESQKEDNGSSRGEITESDYNSRPSKNFVSDASPDKKGGFFNKKGDLSGSKKALKSENMILQAAEAGRDEILSIAYMFGTFKTRMTGVDKFSGKGMAKSEKNSRYMPVWRYAHDDGEIDMRFEPKKDRKTVLRSEMEYLIFGNRTDLENESAVYAAIFAERLANNMQAMYTEKKVVKPACRKAALAASAATEFTVPKQVFFWIFLTAWATAETTLDMYYLIDCGYRIPMWKTNKNILLNDIPTGKGLVTNYGEPDKSIFVTYEDYLLILLLLKASEKRIMRSADLIEVNMRANGEKNFSISKAYTYLKADSQLSIRYLFGGTAPFKQDYEKNGVTGRLKFTNKIYQGY